MRLQETRNSLDGSSPIVFPTSLGGGDGWGSGGLLMQYMRQCKREASTRSMMTWPDTSGGRKGRKMVCVCT